MNGFIFKTIALTFTLLSSLTFATSAAKSQNKTKIFNQKLGCMMCHQGGSVKPDKDLRQTNN